MREVLLKQKNMVRTFDLEPALFFDAVDMGAKIGCGCNEIQSLAIILVKLK